MVEGTKQNSNTDKVHARDRPAQGMPRAARRRGNDGRPVAEAAAAAAPDADAEDDTEDFVCYSCLKDQEPSAVTKVFFFVQTKLLVQI